MRDDKYRVYESLLPWRTTALGRGRRWRVASAGVAVLVASSLAGTGSAAASVTPGQASAVAQQGSCHPRVIDMGTLGGVESE